jgi:cob(I)alamin adenosyltransferase
MAITTGEGDRGETVLLFDRPIAKRDVRLDAYGTMDELNALLGLARNALQDEAQAKLIRDLQEELFVVSSELVVAPRDAGRLELRVTEARVRRLEEQIRGLEEQLELQECCFVTPGQNRAAALLDVCRSVARRAERLAWKLDHQEPIPNRLALTYLNRLSDLLWLLARAQEESTPRVEGPPLPGGSG